MQVTDWVLTAERAYVAAAIARGAAFPPTIAATVPLDVQARAIAAAGAIASRFLAVGAPRSFSIVINAASAVEAAALALVAHRTWFAPRDLRCATSDPASPGA